MIDFAYFSRVPIVNILCIATGDFLSFPRPAINHGLFTVINLSVQFYQEQFSFCW